MIINVSPAIIFLTGGSLEEAILFIIAFASTYSAISSLLAREVNGIIR